MPRRTVERDCNCGCGGKTRGGEFLPGHDSKLYAAIIDEVGGLVNLLHIVEKSIGKRILVKHQ